MNRPTLRKDSQIGLRTRPMHEPPSCKAVCQRHEEIAGESEPLSIKAFSTEFPHLRQKPSFPQGVIESIRDS